MVEVVPAARDVVTVRLRHPAGKELPSWSPGAHIRCELPSGRVRPFSLCGRPDDTTSYVIAVQRRAGGRGGSREIHDSDLEGQTLVVHGPYNSFRLEPASGYLFAADGAGVAPFRPMARESSARTVPWRALLRADDPQDVAFLDELRALPGGQADLLPVSGGYDELEAAIRRLPAGHHVYCCGSRALVETIRDLCIRHHSEHVLHTESCPGPIP